VTAQLALTGLPVTNGEIVTVDASYCRGEAERPMAITCRVNLDGTGPAESMVDPLVAEWIEDRALVLQVELTEMWNVKHFRQHVAREAYSVATLRRNNPRR